ncbi:Hypothetical predicted protein [Paramuricea clavata]|uniref:Uncharacterized protein n=1 Tax=Paramuricea clavata TaxID=317549 RepID=A0A7D9ET53_PARCT|nr:Hypothetical predicted protein [Paramuricea clavata]
MSERRPLFCVEVLYPVLKVWHNYKRTNTTIDYIDLLEATIPGGCFVFSHEESVWKEVDDNLARIADFMAQLYRKSKGRYQQDVDDKVKKFHVFQGQNKEVAKFKAEISKVKDELEFQSTKLQEEIDDWRKHEYKSFRPQVDSPQVVSPPSRFAPSHFAPVAKAEVALWLSEAFRIEIEALHVNEPDTGAKRLLYFSVNNRESESVPEQKNSRYSSLDENERKKQIEEILFLLDKFCVHGDSFYHELSMLHQGLPRSYLIKQCGDDLNAMCHIDRLPGSSEGAKVHSIREVIVEHVKEYLAKLENFD